MPQVTITSGGQILLARRKARISQGELSKSLGVMINTISDVENGNVSLSDIDVRHWLATIQRLAEERDQPCQQ